MLRRIVNYVDHRLHLINTPKYDFVPVRVLSVVDIGKANKVYDLTVKDDHEFVASGVLVHNCIDAIRYALGPLIKRPKRGKLFV